MKALSLLLMHALAAPRDRLDGESLDEIGLLPQGTAMDSDRPKEHTDSARARVARTAAEPAQTAPTRQRHSRDKEETAGRMAAPVAAVNRAEELSAPHRDFPKGSGGGVRSRDPALMGSVVGGYPTRELANPSSIHNASTIFIMLAVVVFSGCLLLLPRVGRIIR